MKGLMELLAKSGDETPSTESSETTMGDEADVSADSFAASASAAMDAIQSGDADAFTEALRACIEMSAA